ncbi:Uncharacterised protein [Mycobacteroides abscessus subsp. abscessus]|nr:Uncharacterised protein [Mycobacteroides abscessus subsp. abscessus]
MPFSVDSQIHRDDALAGTVIVLTAPTARTSADRASSNVLARSDSVHTIAAVCRPSIS